MRVMIGWTTRIAMIVLLVVLSGPGGGAYPHATVATTPVRSVSQRLVRPRVGLPRHSVPPHVMQSPTQTGDSQQSAADDLDDSEMSAMGRLARLSAKGQLERLIAKARANAGRWEPIDERPADDEEEEEGDDESEGPAGGQAELALAVDSTGMHIVVGANDTRGFALNPISVSGYRFFKS